MCHQCQTKPVYEFTNKRKVCGNCFVRYFQKKVFYTIRKFEMIKRGEVVGYVRGSNFRSIVLEDVLKMLGKKGIEIVQGAKPSQIKISKIAEPTTTDIIAYKIINEIIQGNSNNLKEFLPVDKKIIKPLCLFLDKEVLLYAKLKKLKFKKVVEEKSKTSLFIDELEKKHPEVKRAVVNGLLKLH